MKAEQAGRTRDLTVDVFLLQVKLALLEASNMLAVRPSSMFDG